MQQLPGHLNVSSVILHATAVESKHYLVGSWRVAIILNLNQWHLNWETWLCTLYPISSGSISSDWPQNLDWQVVSAVRRYWWLTTLARITYICTSCNILSFRLGVPLNSCVSTSFLMSSQQEQAAVQAASDAYMAAHPRALLSETEVIHQSE